MTRTSAFFALALAAGALSFHAACSSGGGTVAAGGSHTGAGGNTTTSSGTTTSTTSTTDTSSGTTTTTTTTTTTGTGGGPADAGSDGSQESLCVQTGGTETMQPCCTSQGDFPNSCTVGACTCAPPNTHMIKACKCPMSKCYDPAKGCTGGA